jgi:hypothetical protein
MKRKAKWGFLAAIVVPFEVALLLLAGSGSVAQALGEYLRPTTVWGNYLPEGCIETNDAPPPDLMQIVKNQRNLYHMSLQKVVVCRSARRLPGFEARSAGLPFGDEDECRTSNRGCCSCQFGRHFIVMAADPNENGSILLRANLIQSRGDYLRLKYNALQKRVVWSGTLVLICALFVLFSARRLAKAIRHAFHGSA